mgnify:CR=1 FL=1
MEFEILKGTKDSTPDEQIIINQITDVMRKNFESYGFRPFDTPVIEYFDTLTNKYDENDEIVQEIFKLSDRGDRKLGLRYDLTIPLCRYISSQKQIKLPFRRYQLAKVFRDGPIKKGRLREFMQCDCDIIGTSGQEVEAELLTLFYETYKEIGINAIIEVNNNKILRGALLQNGFEENELQSLILSIDKLKKIGEKGVLDEIKQKGFDIDRAKNSLDILRSMSFKEIENKSTNEILLEGINELKTLSKLLRSQRIKFAINFSMARGLNIYTGNIWEAYDSDKSITSSIGSGGRYDKAIGNFIDDGRDFPAVGISFGLVPIMACLEDRIKQKQGVSEVLICPLDKSLVPTALKIAKKFRKNKTKTEVYYEYKLKKAFDYADYIGAKKIVIIGKKDIEEKKYTVKNLKTRKEIRVKI